MFFEINSKASSKKVNGKCEKVNKEGLLNENDRNLAQIVCRRCGSIFFANDSVEFIENHPVDLRVMTHQGAGPLQSERVSWWWYTNDDMDFDTIGWQTLDKKKMLMCGDCELGPVGWRTEDNTMFYLAVERCSYKRVDDEETEEETEEKSSKETSTKEKAIPKEKASPKEKAPLKKVEPVKRQELPPKVEKKRLLAQPIVVKPTSRKAPVKAPTGPPTKLPFKGDKPLFGSSKSRMTN